MIFSHPKKSLYEHLNNVEKIGSRILDSKKLNFSIIDLKTVKKINSISLFCHDLGKTTSFFQDYIISVNKNAKNSKYKNHGLLSAILAFIIAKKLLDNDLHSFIVFILVLKHHGDLDNFENYFSKLKCDDEVDILNKQIKAINYIELEEILNSFKFNIPANILNQDSVKSTISYVGKTLFMLKIKRIIKNMEFYILINLLFSVLIFSDKTDAIFYGANEDIDRYFKMKNNKKIIKSALVDNFKNSLKSSNKKMVLKRNEIYNDVVESISEMNLKNRILSINLPTGAGKTIISLKSALVLKERLKQECDLEAKIIYILPFTSIIEQNYDVFKKIINSNDTRVLMKHHYLSEREYLDSDGNSEDLDYGITEHLIETWESDIIVSTFVQLLHSILSNKNRKLKKYHNITNSIIILDEVQSIPYKYWKLVRELFIYMSKILNCYFIFITATMPLIFSENNKEIFELAKYKEKYFKEMFNRYDVDTKYLKKTMDLSEFCLVLHSDIKLNSDKSYLIVLNTVKSSIYIFENLKELFKNEIEFYYLSTNVIPKDRMTKITEIKNTKKRKVVVSTQMIEAGVDIDLDVVYRDFSPMDNINQTAGRCNREGKNKIGKVYIVKLIDENTNREYSSYIYDYILLNSTENILKNIDKFNEKNVFELSYKYYNELEKYGSDNESSILIERMELLKYREAFTYGDNKYIFKLIDDEFKTIDVFVETDEESIEVWNEYQEIFNIKNRFKRKIEFDKIKPRLHRYIISIPEKILKRHIEIEECKLNYINNDMIFDLYDYDTGFKRENEKDYVF
ncbi:MAG: CRISPR-associated helicase Cas3' [Clostridiales bacterium]